MDASTVDGFSRASSWSSVAVVGGGVGGPFTMLYLSEVITVCLYWGDLTKLDWLDHLFSETNGRGNRVYLVHRA